MPVRVGRVLIWTSDMTTNTSVSYIHSVDESCTSPFYLLLIEVLTLVVLLVFGGGVVGIRRRNRNERQNAKVSTDT